MDPLQRMGAVRMRVHTDHKNVTIHSMKQENMKSYMFVCNKQIHQGVLTLKHSIASVCCAAVRFVIVALLFY